MKKYLLPCLALFFLFSCEDDTEQESYEMNIRTTKKAKKIDVCHKGKIINVSINAIAAHQGHGDAVDMDGDGYFDIDNPCSETDCDDSAYDSENSCSCVEGELEVNLPGGFTLYVYPDDNSDNIKWGGHQNDIDNLVNITTPGAANLDFSGAANTAAIVAELGDNNDESYAAKLCADLSDETGCDWYLPAAGELNAMYEQLGPDGNRTITSGNYWSSTEETSTTGWRQNFGNGSQSPPLSKLANMRCRCVRR